MKSETLEGNDLGHLIIPTYKKKNLPWHISSPARHSTDDWAMIRRIICASKGNILEFDINFLADRRATAQMTIPTAKAKLYLWITENSLLSNSIRWSSILPVCSHNELDISFTGSLILNARIEIIANNKSLRTRGFLRKPFYRAHQGVELKACKTHFQSYIGHVSTIWAVENITKQIDTSQ